MVILFPGMVVGDAQKAPVDLDKIQFEAAPRGYGDAPAPGMEPPADGTKTPGDGCQRGSPEASDPAQEDPMEAVRRALQSDAAKK